MFVIWRCGCKGLKLGDRNIVITTCDHNYGDSEFTFWERNTDLHDREFTVMEDNQVKEFMTKISATLVDGHRFQEIKFLLGIPNK